MGVSELLSLPRSFHATTVAFGTPFFPWWFLQPHTGIEGSRRMGAGRSHPSPPGAPQQPVQDPSPAALLRHAGFAA